MVVDFAAEFDAELDSSDCETSVVFVVLAPDLPFIKGYIISNIVERIARIARTIREVSWARFLLVD